MIIALAGRRIDAEETEDVRFPLTQVPIVNQRLVQSLKKLGCQTLICSGACGADLLALSVAASLGIKRYMVLPFNPQKFLSVSVIDRPGQWGVIFEQIYKDVLSRNCIIQLDLDPENDTTYSLTNEVIIEKAVKLAKHERKSKLGTISGLLVWEGKGYGQSDTTDLFRQQVLVRGLEIHEVLTL